MQLLFLKTLRRLIPDKTITYTFPGDNYFGDSYPWIGINYPFLDVIEYGNQYIDTFNVFRTNYPSESINQMEEEFGIPKSKIVWGLMIGCNENPHFEDVSLDTARNIAAKVKDEGYAGVMTWSINRDTDHRVEPKGTCNNLQTGYEDGSYLQLIKETLQAK